MNSQKAEMRGGKNAYGGGRKCVHGLIDDGGDDEKQLKIEKARQHAHLAAALDLVVADDVDYKCIEYCTLNEEMNQWKCGRACKNKTLSLV